MKKSILSTIAAVLVIVTSGIAQQEIVVVEQGSRYKREKKEIRLNENTSVFKFSPTQMLAGEIHFSFEKQIDKNSSFELAAGPTISNIALGSANSHYFDPWGSSYVYQSSRLGMFVEAAYRYYPLEETEALNRFYVSPVVKFKMMNFGLEDAAEVLQSEKGSEMNVNFLFNIGYQLWLSKSFSMDFYTGMGIGYQQMDSFRAETTWVDPNYESQWVSDSWSGARFVFSIGVKVGIGHKPN